MSVHTLEKLKEMLKNLQIDYECAKQELIVEEKEYESLQILIKEMDNKFNDLCSDVKTYRNTYQVRNILSTFVVRCCEYTDRLKEILKQMDETKLKQIKANITDSNLERTIEQQHIDITNKETILNHLIDGNITSGQCPGGSDYVSQIDSILLTNIKKEIDMQAMRQQLKILEEKIASLTKFGSLK